MALGLLVFGFLHWVGGMGAGDVKLVAAIGAWVGPSQLAIALVMTGMAGGLLAVAWALAGGFLGDALTGASDVLLSAGRHRPAANVAAGIAGELSMPAVVLRRAMPYAPAIAVGTLLSFFAQ
jgi:prepilin peptidase CpaA